MLSRLLTLSVILLCFALCALACSLTIEQGILVYESYENRHPPARCCPCPGCPDCRCGEWHFFGVEPAPKR